MKITGDIETFSRCDLKKAGMARYAEDESTDINCFCWAIDDGPVHSWIPQGDEEFKAALIALKDPALEGGTIWIGSTVPGELRFLIGRAAELHAWNAAFERLNLNGPAGQRYGFPKIEISQTWCSMLNARVHGLPGALEDAANALNTPIKKRIAGVNAMRYLCKPRKDGTRPMLVEERERFLALIPYCADDVRAERGIDAVVPPMSAQELRIYRELDQPMNDRGWKVDLAAVDALESLVQQYKAELEGACLTLTGIKPSRPGPLADWIRSKGFPELENLQADTVRKALMKEMPQETKRILSLYSTYGMKSVMKFPAMRKAAGSGARLRHLFGMYGAGTGRWVSYIVQLQNLFRALVDSGVAVEIAMEWSLQYVRDMYPGIDPMKVFASCVRSCLVADEGKDLLFPDFSGVEARWNSWMFGEEWELKAYRDYDAGIGPNVYVANYARSYGIPADSQEAIEGKQLGKVLVLSMGYEVGVGAFVKMAGTYRVDLKDMAEKTYPTLPRDVLDESIEAFQYAEEQGRTYELPSKVWITCEGLKRMWRRAHPNIVRGWVDLKEAAIGAVSNPGKIHSVAKGRIAFRTEQDWLVMRLPSGRKMWYYKPRIKEDKQGRQALHYLGMNTVTRQWGPTSTYGGKLCENETQGGCRDLLVYAKFDVAEMGLPLIGTVHDQPAYEVDEGFDGEAEVAERMCRDRKWNSGLPLAVEMHRGKRFRK